MNKAEDAVKCVEGGVHKLTYLGRTRDQQGRVTRLGMYRCENCGELVSKADLKEATDYA